MSNFLRHLIQRSLSPAATLQPRLASRFESGAAPARFTEERIETAAALVAPMSSQPVVSAIRPLAAAPAEEPNTAASPSPMEARLSATPPPEIPSVAVPVATSPVPPAAVSTAPAPVAPIASVTTPATTTASETFSLPPASTSTLLIEHFTERIREISPAPGIGVSSSDTTTIPSLSAPAFTPATPKPAAERISPSSPPAALPPVAPATPAVRVTIGRVDIRAIHVPPATPVRAPAPDRRPLVSLEAYLSQRDAK